MTGCPLLMLTKLNQDGTWFCLFLTGKLLKWVGKRRNDLWSPCLFFATCGFLNQVFEGWCELSLFFATPRISFFTQSFSFSPLFYKKHLEWTISGVPLPLHPRPRTGVKAVQRTRSAFAALKKDGTVVTWGDSVNFRSLSRFLVWWRNASMCECKYPPWN